MFSRFIVPKIVPKTDGDRTYIGCGIYVDGSEDNRVANFGSRHPRSDRVLPTTQDNAVAVRRDATTALSLPEFSDL